MSVSPWAEPALRRATSRESTDDHHGVALRKVNGFLLDGADGQSLKNVADVLEVELFGDIYVVVPDHLLMSFC